MIRRIITRWAAKWLNRARDDHRISERDRFKAKAQSMRLAMGMPAHPALSTKEN